MERERMERTRCAMPTKAISHCERLATRYYLDARGDVIRALCTQHANGAGVARMLRPMPWEYSRVVDRNGRNA
jgi:hypothetical protein